jgi:hypothetical protein
MRFICANTELTPFQYKHYHKGLVIVVVLYYVPGQEFPPSGVWVLRLNSRKSRQSPHANSFTSQIEKMHNVIINSLTALNKSYQKKLYGSFKNSRVCVRPFSLNKVHFIPLGPVPLAARSKVCGRSPAEIVGSNPTGGIYVCRVCCQVEVSATSWLLVQRSLADCGASLSVI